jgi:hypothetical protein
MISLDRRSWQLFLSDANREKLLWISIPASTANQTTEWWQVFEYSSPDRVNSPNVVVGHLIDADEWVRFKVHLERCSRR